MKNGLIMRNQPWDLICESNPEKFGELISYIFSNQYIFTHLLFRKSLQGDRKGYIHVSQLLKQELVINYFGNNEVDQQIKVKYIHFIIEHFCHELIFKNNRIRRINPFDTHLFTQTKPLCIEKIQNQLTISDIRDHLGQSAFSHIQNFQPTNDLQFLYIYAPNYRQKLERNGLGIPFKIVQYQKLCEQRQRESRYWQQQQKRFYMGINLEDIAQKMRRQQLMKSQFRQCREEHRQMDDQLIDENDEISLQQIRMTLQPNLQLNSLLSTFVSNMERQLDQQ